MIAEVTVTVQVAACERFPRIDSFYWSKSLLITLVSEKASATGTKKYQFFVVTVGHFLDVYSELLYQVSVDCY